MDPRHQHLDAHASRRVSVLADGGWSRLAPTSIGRLARRHEHNHLFASHSMAYQATLIGVAPGVQTLQGVY